MAKVSYNQRSTLTILLTINKHFLKARLDQIQVFCMLTSVATNLMEQKDFRLGGLFIGIVGLVITIIWVLLFILGFHILEPHT